MGLDEVIKSSIHLSETKLALKVMYNFKGKSLIFMYHFLTVKTENDKILRKPCYFIIRDCIRISARNMGL